MNFFAKLPVFISSVILMVSGFLMAEVTAVKANNDCSIIGRLMDQSIFTTEDAAGDLNQNVPAGLAGLKHF